MKRFVIFVLVFSLLIIPATADSWYSDFQQDHVDILDYSTPNGLDSFSLTYTSGSSIIFAHPTRQYFSYFDILLTMNTGSISSATIDGKALTVMDVGNRVYRLYGQFSRATYQNIELIINSTASANITFLSFDAYANHSSPVGLTGQFTWERFADTTEQGTREQTSFRDPVSINKPPFANPIYDSATLPWKIFATADDWNKYDFLSFGFSTDMSIDSIMVNSDLGQLPFTTNEFLIGNDASNVNLKYIYVVVDIRGIPRNSNSSPTLVLSLSQDASIPGNFALQEVLGFLDFDYEEPQVYWLRRLFNYSNTWWSWLIDNLTTLGSTVSNGFSNIVSSLTSNFNNLSSWITSQTNSVGQWFRSVWDRLDNIADILSSDSQENNDAAEDFNSQVETQADELQDLTDSMNSVQRPDISDVKLGVGDLVNQNSFNLATAGFSSLLGMEYFTRILMMALTFALIGFVLFGKR